MIKNFISRLKMKEIIIDPTPDVKRGFYVGTMKIPAAATLHRYEKSYAKMVEFVGRLYKAGADDIAHTRGASAGAGSRDQTLSGP